MDINVAGDREKMSILTKLAITFVMLLIIVFSTYIILQIVGMALFGGILLIALFSGALAELSLAWIQIGLITLMFVAGGYLTIEMIINLFKNGKKSFYIKLFRVLRWVWDKKYDIDIEE